MTPRYNDWWGHFSIGKLTQVFSSLLSCVEHIVQGTLGGYLEEFSGKISPTCLLPIILPIREPCWHKGEVVSVGPTVHCSCWLWISLPLSGDMVQTRGVALTRWGGDGRGGWLFRAGKSGQNIGFIRTHVADLAHKSALVSVLPKMLGEVIKP